jgi:pullulanase
MKQQDYSQDIHITSAFMDDFYAISVYFNAPVTSKTAAGISLYQSGRVADYSIQRIIDHRVVINVEHIDIKCLYTIGWFEQSCEVIPHKVLDRPEFNYNGDDLGVTRSGERYRFRIWSPSATSVTLNLYDSVTTDKGETFHMEPLEHGTWLVVLDRECEGLFYSYSVDGALSLMDPGRELLDPYARCVIGNTGRALIPPDDLLQPLKSSSPDFSVGESVIYELHVRDFSIHPSSGARARGQYSALSEKETWLDGDKSTGIPTMISHCRELGVNTLQLLPLQDFDNPEEDPDFYAWGYMPRHFNTPDGAYTEDWRTEQKIRDIRDFVTTLHEAGFKLILDVVYNHTAEGFSGDGIYSFNGFAPCYYYRVASNGHISNGSGCGNEMRSEAPMVRKFIVESLVYWTTVYGFDGYRFDLMGLVDIDTMQEVVDTLRVVKPGIFIYGEPWTGGITPIDPTCKGKQKNRGFSVFNDEFRDAIKGPVFDALENGYIQSAGHKYKEKIIQGILGSINTFAYGPLETLNYVEVHDNNTLFDKLCFTTSEQEKFAPPSGSDLEQITAMHKLAAFILLTSQGIPVLHLGQDFMRTKHGVENSYNAGDSVNNIDWNRKREFHDVFNYYRSLVTIRKEHPLLRLPDEYSVREAIHFRYEMFPAKYSNAIAYTLDGGSDYGDSVERLLVIINPYPTALFIDLNDHPWKKLLTGDQIYGTVDATAVMNIQVPAISGAILYS